MTPYIEQREGGYYVAGTRVSLDSLVYAFRSGESAETIQQQFPSLSLEQVYGAIAFYLGHQAEVDANIHEGEEQIPMPKHFASFLGKGNRSPGVLLVIPQDVPLRSAVDTLVLIWADNRPGR